MCLLFVCLFVCLFVLSLLDLFIILNSSCVSANRLKLFLEQFSIRACVLNSELPHNSRYVHYTVQDEALLSLPCCRAYVLIIYMYCSVLCWVIMGCVVL